MKKSLTYRYMPAACFLLAFGTMTSAASAQDNFTFVPQGRLQVDYTNADADNSNPDFDGFELRRAYLGANGKLGAKLSYNVDFGVDETGKVTPIVAFVDWKPLGKGFRVRAGQFKSFLSLDESTSSRFTSTIERAAFTDSFNIQRRVGVGVIQRGKNYTLSAAVLGGAIDRQPFGNGSAVSARATYTPYLKKKEVVHLGASFRYRESNDDRGLERYTQRPFTHNSNAILSTGRIADSDTTFIGEAAWVKDKAWVAAEYAINSADCPVCTSDPTFNGFYVEAGRFFRGRRVYKNGKFVRPKVYDEVTEGGRGALALVARYDSLDLTDSGADGGQLDTIILGADWYLTKYAKLTVNYFNADADLGASRSRLDPAFVALQRAGIRNETVNGFVLRAQYDF